MLLGLILNSNEIITTAPICVVDSCQVGKLNVVNPSWDEEEPLKIHVITINMPMLFRALLSLNRCSCPTTKCCQRHFMTLVTMIIKFV